MLVFLFLLIGLAVFLQYWSMGHSLDGLEHLCFPDKPLVEPDEVFHLVNRVTNRTRRFVPWLRISQLIPKDLKLLDGARSVNPYNGDTNALSYAIYLLPRQTWRQELRATLPRRGRYPLTNTILQGGGFLGFNELVGYTTQHEEIIVLPARCADPGLENTLGGFLGDRSVDRFILEDPVLTLGFREYTGREPMKNISWTQSARSGQLMVKKFDYTLELTAAVVLNIETEHTEGWEDRIEKCYSMARTVCEVLEEKRISYRFVTNAGAAGAISSWSQVSDGLGDRHLSTILEGLGRANYEPLRAFDQTLELTARAAEQGRTHILITPENDPRWSHGIRRLEQLSGAPVLVLTAEEVFPV